MLDLFLHNLIVTLQIIPVNNTSPCFYNYSAGFQMWHNCGFDKDYIKASLGPFQYITGGYFSMIFVSILIGAVYLKYHKAVYVLAIGSLFLPISYGVFPEVFLAWAIVMSGIFIGCISWWIFISQSNET